MDDTEGMISGVKLFNPVFNIRRNGIPSTGRGITWEKGILIWKWEVEVWIQTEGLAKLGRRDEGSSLLFVSNFCSEA